MLLEASDATETELAFDVVRDSRLPPTSSGDRYPVDVLLRDGPPDPAGLGEYIVGSVYCGN